MTEYKHEMLCLPVYYSS